MNELVSDQFVALEANAPGPVTLKFAPQKALFSLRMDPGNSASAAKAFAAKLATRVGRGSVSKTRSALCCGPDEWFLSAPENDRRTICDAFVQLGKTTPHSLVDISDREVAIDLSGPLAIDLLSIGCPANFDQLSVGWGRRTLFDTVQIMVIKLAQDSYRIYVWRSFVPHVWGLLARGNREFAAGY